MGCNSPAPGEVPRAEYDQSGRLRQLAFDADGDGRNDAVATLDGARLQRIDASPLLNLTAQQLNEAFVAAAARINLRAVVPVLPPGGPSR